MKHLGFKNKLKQIEKELKKLPDSHEMRVITKFDGKNLGVAKKSMTSLMRNWNTLQRRTAGGLFSFMKDKRQINDLNNYFGKLKFTFMESMGEYQKQLDILAGKNEKLGKDSEFYEVTNKIVEANNELDNQKQKYDELIKQRDKLLNQQKQLEFLPSEKQLLSSMSKIQDKMEKMNNKLIKARENSIETPSNQNLLQKDMGKATDRFDYVSQMAAAEKWQYKGANDETSRHWDTLVEKITNMDRANKSQEKIINDEINKLELTEMDLQIKLRDALNNFKTTHEIKYSNLADNITSQLEDTRQRLQDEADLLMQNDISKKLVEKYKKSLENARLTKGSNYSDTHGGDYNSLQADVANNIKMFNQDEKLVWKDLSNMSSLGNIQSLENQMSTLKTEIENLKTNRINIQKTDNKKSDVKQQIDEANKSIKEQEKQIKIAEQSVRQWEQALINIKNKIIEIKTQMELLVQDSKINPFDFKFKSDPLQPMNNATDNLQRRWGALGNIMSKIQAKLNGIKGYMKQLNPITRVWRRVWINIYSQIAALVNPLNIFRKAWNSWINQHDNIVWKNTFDVIGYNLTRVVAPAMEKIATLLLKIAAVANVFTKKWFNIDLFDKSAWSAEQLKKNVNQLTASFDELHSSNENENALNTVFDTGIIDADSLLSNDWKDKLGKIADTIKKWWDGIIGFIKDHPLLSALAGLGLLGLLSGLGGSILGLAANVLGKLGKMLLDGLGKATGWIAKAVGGWGNLLAGLSIALGAALVLDAEKGTYDLAKKWDQMSKDERWKQIGENIGKGIAGGALIGAGIGFFVGGPMGALIGAGLGAALGGLVLGFQQLAIAAYNGSEAATVAAGALGGAGLGGAVGFLIGGPLGALIGALGGGLVGALGGATVNAFRCTGEFNKLKISAEDLAWAQQQTIDKTEAYNQSLEQLKLVEQEAGITGEQLYNSVQDGSLSIDKMTTSQLAVYNAYNNSIKAMEEMNKAQETELSYTARVMLDNDKKANSFTNYIYTMKKGMEDGIISHEQMIDNFAQGYAELSPKQREIFINQLPENIRQSVEEQSKQYISSWEKFKTEVHRRWEELKTSIWNFISNIGKNSDSKWAILNTKANETWQKIRKGASEGWSKIQNAINEKIKSIKEGISNGLNNISKKANETWQKIKNLFSGNGWKSNQWNATISSNGNIRSYDVGTNYVPNDQLAYIHKGEAIIPAKYNKPASSYTETSTNNMADAIRDLTNKVSQLQQSVQQGIPVKGQFVQRGSDLVATVERASSKNSNNILNNKVYAR